MVFFNSFLVPPLVSLPLDFISGDGLSLVCWGFLEPGALALLCVMCNPVFVKKKKKMHMLFLCEKTGEMGGPMLQDGREEREMLTCSHNTFVSCWVSFFSHNGHPLLLQLCTPFPQMKA